MHPNFQPVLAHLKQEFADLYGDPRYIMAPPDLTIHLRVGLLLLR